MRQTCQQQGQEVFVKAGLRCQICNTSGQLRLHTRTTGSDNPNDMLVLCENCYDLAQEGKQMSGKSEADKLLVQVILLACLFVGVALVTVGIASISPLILIVLCLVAFFMAFLAVAIQNAFSGARADGGK